jgi:hypothetical protein
MLEDESASVSYQARSALGAQIKAIAVNKIHACHGKRRDIVNLCPWWRLSISLNNEPERMMILPRLGEDVSDKIILLRVTRHPMPMPTATAEEKELFRQVISQQLPGYLSWLENEFKIPNEWVSQRFGISGKEPQPSYGNCFSKTSGHVGMPNVCSTGQTRVAST